MYLDFLSFMPQNVFVSSFQGESKGLVSNFEQGVSTSAVVIFVSPV